MSGGGLSFADLFGEKPDYPYFDGARLRAARAFDRGNASFLAEASLLAYVSDDAVVSGALERAGFPAARLIDGGTTRAIFARGHAGAVLVFRGTRPGSAQDYLLDARLLLTPFDAGGRVHEGFLAGLDAVWGEVRPLLRGRVWYAGHSLGAAMATLAYARAGGGEGLYTYGSPRVGDGAFARGFPGGAYRVVNDNDLVARLPPPGAYQHVGRLVWIDRSGRLARKARGIGALSDMLGGHALRIREAWERWRAGDLSALPFDALVDHSPLHYALHLREASPRR